MKEIIRVFPRETRLTPHDTNVRINCGPGLLIDEADEIHISVSFTYDMERAEILAKYWERVAPVKIGEPATGESGGNFIPGMYLKQGAVITSRGCPNRCWFCSVWRREGINVRELPITNGYNVLDDNLLRCSRKHIEGVFEMLKRQKERPEFTGGLEAAALQDWHIDKLLEVKPKQMFFAYDTKDDFEPIVSAGKRLKEAGFTRHKMRCYVLIGHKGDTFDAAHKRLTNTVKLGFFPQAMLFRDKKGDTQKAWRQFQREWSRPAIIYSKVKKNERKV